MMKQIDSNFFLGLAQKRDHHLIGRKVVRRSRKLLVAFTALFLQINVFAYSQNVSLSVKDAPVEKVLKAINQQTGFSFLYNANLLKKTTPITIDVKNASLKEVLAKCFDEQKISFVVENNTIVLKTEEEAKNNNVRTEYVQQQFVEGVVVDEKGAALQGVTVTVNEKKNMITVTDANGKFRIIFPSDASSLTFSYVGYLSENVKIGINRNIKVVLSPESDDLDLVIVAYGAKRKEELTTSVAKISSKDFEKRPLSNVSNAIAGAAPGVQSNSGNGAPGSGSTIRIRGFGSITGTNAPLYILDGVPYEGVLNNINPDDVESISILKDAASTSLYGARGANGIILITTKKGVKNKTRIDIKSVQGFSQRGLQLYEKADAYQYYPLLWESLRNTYLRNGKTPEDANLHASDSVQYYLISNPFDVSNTQIVRPDGTINPNARLRHADDLNWRDAVTQLGLRNENTLTVYGGSEKTDYFMSFGYLKERGYTLKSDFERANARVKVNSQVTNWFKVGANVAANYTSSQESIENSGLNENPFYVDLLMGPIYYVHKHDPVTGEYLLDASGQRIVDEGDDRPIMTSRNIYSETQYNINKLTRNFLNSRFYGTVSFTKNLKFTGNIGFDVNNYQMMVFDSPKIGDALGRGRVFDTRSTTKYFTASQILNYDKTFDRHSVSLMLGHEYYHRQYDFIDGRSEYQVVDGSLQLNNFSSIINMRGYQDNYKLESYLGRAEYDFDKKYFLSTSFRNDISSKFHPDRRSGWFFSVSAAWQISNEDWFQVPAFDNLKLRTSWGQVGSDNGVGLYAYQSLYNFGPTYNFGSEPGLRMQSTVGNPLIRWETTESSDIAVEFSMFNGRISGEIEYFNRYTKDLLFSRPTPASSGNSSYNDNIGSMVNRGIEISINADIIRHKHFKWNIATNATAYKNVIKSLPQEEITIFPHQLSAGVSRYEFWLRDWYGVNPDNGDGLYYANGMTGKAFVNAKGDTVTPDANEARFNYFGTSIPDVYGGITNTFTYKNFSFTTLFTYQIGGKVYDRDYQSIMYDGTWGRALHADAMNSWKTPGQETDVPKRMLGTEMFGSSRFLTSGTYITLRSASLTYELPRTFINKMKATAGRVYITGENLFINTSRRGLNPTQVYEGDPSYTYAPARTLTVGLNLSF